MTSSEAIKIIKGTWSLMCQTNINFDCITDYQNAAKIAVKSIEEIEEYRKIGTVKECRVAMEKQKPKKPDYEGDGYDDKGELIYDTWICPNCGKKYEVDYDEYDYCPKCGQAIAWSTESFEK